MKTLSIYAKNCGDIIINIEYILSIKKKYYEGGLGKCEYIITMVNGYNIFVEEYHFNEVKEKLKEMGVL